MMQSVELNNGVQMPSLGFGTGALLQWQLDHQKVADVISSALKVGYRHFDTASMYGNERSVGWALRHSGIERGEVFVTTKAWASEQGYDEVRRAFDRSSARLGLEVVDLYLLHWPIADKMVESWKAMEELLREKRVRAIGVSNFQISDLEKLLSESEVMPACNQIELHPYFSQRELCAYCQDKGIQIVSYSPLGTGTWSGIAAEKKPVADPTIATIASHHGATPAQVILRWNLHRGFVPIPKSENPERIRENFNSTQLSLSEGEIDQINRLDRGERFNLPPEKAAQELVDMVVPV